MTRTERRRAWSHLGQLADRHRVTMYPTVSRWKAEAHIEKREVWVPRAMRSPIDYLIALHELGHVCSPLARWLHQSASLQHDLASEAAAWAWAVEHADPALLALVAADTWTQVGAALVSFLRLAGPDSLPA